MLRAIVLITDGHYDCYDCHYDYTGKTEAKNLRAKGVKIVAIGVGQSVKKSYLEELTGDPKLVWLTTFATLVQDASEVLALACANKKL